MDNNKIEELLNCVDVNLDESYKQRIIKSINSTPFQKHISFKEKIYSINKRVVATFASILLIIGIVIGFSITFYNESYSKIFIDINPSIELDINRFDRVCDIKYLNDDSKLLFSNSKIKGEKSEDALLYIVEKLEDNDYLSEGVDLYISGYSEKDNVISEKIKSVSNKIEEKLNKKGISINITNDKITKEDIDNCKDNISPSKYKLISQIIELDNKYTLNQLKDFSMTNLKKLYKELLQEENNHGNNNNGNKIK